jgi:gas vesicle protein
MIDEITKHSRRIYNTLKSPGKRFFEKFKEVFIEVFIIVFSVTLSIGLHSWSQHRDQQQEVREFLSDLKDDLNKDVENISDQQALMAKTIKQYSFIENLTKEKLDSLLSNKVKIETEIIYVIRKTNDGNYEGFKSSGKIGFIENKKLKKMILEYYQESMPAIDETEKYINVRLGKIEELIYQDKEIRKKLLDPMLKTSLDAVVQTAQNNKKNYASISECAKEIIAEINKEEAD